MKAKTLCTIPFSLLFSEYRFIGWVNRVHSRLRFYRVVSGRSFHVNSIKQQIAIVTDFIIDHIHEVKYLHSFNLQTPFTKGQRA